MASKISQKFQMSMIILYFFLAMMGCSRYQPATLINYTREGEEISVQKLTEGSSPSWSPDGNQIAFQADGIWIMDLLTKRKNRLTHRGSNPNWAPVGNKIAYVHNGIWIWDINQEAHKLLNPFGDHPCWFPDGNTLAFNHQGIWRIDIDGAEKRKIFNNGNGLPLSFSPDGSSLLIERWEPDRLFFHLGIFDISSGEFRYLVDGTKGSFAPDGYSVVYSLKGLWVYSMIGRDSKGIVMDGPCPHMTPVTIGPTPC